jgi:hypothetical protein
MKGYGMMGKLEGGEGGWWVFSLNRWTQNNKTFVSMGCR